MNKTFQKADQQGRVLILELLQEERKALYVCFKMEAHDFFKENYKKIYESFFISPNHDDIQLSTGIVRVDSEKNTVCFKYTQHWSSDADRYDDSCYQVFTCPAYPDGLEFEIPIELIGSLTTSRTSLEGFD